MASIDIDDFVMGYAEAALWSSTDENENPLDDVYSTPGAFTSEDWKTIEDECKAFVAAHAQNLDRFSELRDREASYLGHDLWLTRNRHGAGFWDRSPALNHDTPGEVDQLAVVAQSLTEAAEALGEQALTANGDKVAFL